MRVVHNARHIIARCATIAIPLAVGAALYAFARISLAAGGVSVAWLAADTAFLFGAVLVGNCAIAMTAARPWKIREALLTPLAFLAGTACFFSLAETAVARAAIAALAIVLLAVYAEQLRLDSLRSGPESSLEYLAYPMRVLAAFFLFTFLFALNLSTNAPLAALAVAAALTVGILAFETLLGEGRVEGARALAVVLALLGCETFAVLTLLPTSPIVNAACAAVALGSALQVPRHLFKGTYQPRLMYRQFAFSLLFIALMMYTAQWV